MLVGTQRQELIAALFSAFPTLPDLDLMLLTRVNQRRERMSTAMAGGVPNVIAAIVEAAEKEFWTPNLIAGAVASAPGNESLRALIARYPELAAAAAATEVDHYSAKFLVGRRVFLCRPTLRGHLRGFGQGLTSRVLVVNGPRGSGKTYSRTFIGYLLTFDPNYQTLTHDLAYVDVDAGVTDLESLAKTIGLVLGLTEESFPPPPKADKEQKSRRTPVLLNWLLKGIKAHQADVLWLVIDGSHLAELTTDESDLLNALGDFADNGGTSKLRLVLLNYNKPGVLPYSLNEQIPEVVVSRDDVKQFVAAVYGMTSREADEAVITQTVDGIFQYVQHKVAGDPTQPHRQLEFLSEALTRTANSLLTTT